ncbi:MAG: hypothetical protein OEU26_13855 [Candidatus Tectomicrobia bacterium]|nr:hypothetical protein [Candidatus Tectomicrobia bacterium]
MIEIEKMGKPAVPIVSGRFEEDAIASARAFAMPDLQFVIVPRIYRNLAHDECIRQTEAVIDDLVHVLTNRDDHKRLSTIETADRHRFEGADRYDAVLQMNEDFIMRDWGDGFPLSPATGQAVHELMQGTSLAPDHLVCDMPPGFGLATVEKIAINAAMAGAKPAHMPVIIAAVQALSQLGSHGGKSLLMSTSCHAPMLVVNGPIAQDLGLNPGSGLGPGRDNRVNITIGRAFSLCLRNLGYWYPGQMDMDTIGTTRKFVHCLAENEAMSPWEPYHVDKGFRRDESAISIFVTDGELDVQDQGNTTAEGLLKTIAYGCTFGTRSLGEGHRAERLIFMPPDVARPVGAQGFSKRGAKEFIHLHANASLGKMIQYMPLEGEARVAANWKWLETLSEQERLDMTVPVLEHAERYDIVVIGADRAKTLVMPSGPSSVTVGIDAYR